MPVFARKTSYSGIENKVANQSSSVNDQEPFFKPLLRNKDNFIQRQPDTKTDDKAVKKPDLSSMSAKDPASTKSHPALINSALLASKYAKYFSDKLKDAGAIDAKDKFMIASSKQDFVNDYNKCYGTNVSTLSAVGFYCPATREIHLIPNADFGMAFHESVHKSSALAYVIDSNNAWKSEPQFAFDIDEGLTSFYTKDILESDYKINNYLDGYANQRRKAAAFIKSYGEDEVAKFYFQYNFMPLLRKFGVTTIKGDMNNLLVSKIKAAF
jgi:hypothetical protein